MMRMVKVRSVITLASTVVVLFSSGVLYANEAKKVAALTEELDKVALKTMETQKDIKRTQRKIDSLQKSVKNKESQLADMDEQILELQAAILELE